MKNIDNTETISSLNEILKYELAGVVKYTHFALMVTGPNRLSLDKFFKENKPRNPLNMLNKQGSC